MKTYTKKEKIIATFFTVLLVVLFIVGTTYALTIFTDGSDINTIKSGKISMHYTESSNVINLTNALPMSDTDGKVQTEYFDFTIMSNADTNADDNDGVKIPYNLIIEPKAVDSDKDALTSSQIKVYLTKVEGTTETQVLAPTKISALTPVDTNFKLYNTENIHKNNNGMITTNYRLRAWIDYGVDTSTWNQTSKPKQYKFGINVDATGKTVNNINLDKSGANQPVLTSNMIPVYYDVSDNNWKKADDTNSNENYKWYDYDNKMWANAVTVNDTNRATYLSADAGTPIPMDDINAMFVWIPRYKYTYFASKTPTEIPITFENGTESTGTISCTETIVASSGKSENCTDTTNGSIIKGTSTYTHPAFTFGDEKLTGIWVGKFENSATEIPTEESTELRTVIIKPDVENWRWTTISYHANSIRNMELVSNIYGFPQSGTTLNIYTGEIIEDSNNIDTHMMKNMEWGAVAYLSHSKYGKNGEVYINNSGNSADISYTGRSGGNIGGYTKIKDTYTNQTSKDLSNTYGFYTYDGYLLNYDTNEKSTTRNLNKVASTTGNIYGIYDMSGGAIDYVMGNMQDESNAFSPDYHKIWSVTNKPLDKYYDKYSYGSNDTEYTRGKLGDATIEMGPENKYTWYGRGAFFLSSFSWFERGSAYFGGTEAGIFKFTNGNRIDLFSSRTVLSVSVS